MSRELSKSISVLQSWLNDTRPREDVYVENEFLRKFEPKTRNQLDAAMSDVLRDVLSELSRQKSVLECTFSNDLGGLQVALYDLRNSLQL
jgi:hypothetical protein